MSSSKGFGGKSIIYSLQAQKFYHLIIWYKKNIEISGFRKKKKCLSPDKIS